MTTPTQDRELLEQALEDLCSTFGSTNIGKKNRTIAALRARLAQPDAIGVAGGGVPEGWTMDEMKSGSFRIVKPDGVWILVQDKPAGGWNIVWELLNVMFNRSAAPKSGGMAQGEQQWKYVVDALVVGGFVSWEKVDQAIAIYRTVAHPAASTGAGQISLPRIWGIGIDAASPGERCVLVSFERRVTDDELRGLHDLIAAAQPKGDGNG